MQALDEKAKEAGVTLLCEMGLDPGIGTHMTLFQEYLCAIIDKEYMHWNRLGPYYSPTELPLLSVQGNF